MTRSRGTLPSTVTVAAAALALLLLRSAGVGVGVVVVLASDFNSPHSHSGVVPPFSPGDPKVKLDSRAVRILGSDRPYQTQMQSGSSGRGLVVQDVSAPTDVVWSRILDYDHYADMVPKTVQSKNYKVIEHRPSRRDPLDSTIYTRMKVGFPVLKLEFFVKHLYYPSLNSLTWTLDYTKKSDFDDSCGYWYVIPHPDDPEYRTRVYYSVQVSMFDWVPKFVVDFMSSKALTDATGWVKKYSEIEWGKDPRRKKEMERRKAEEEAAKAVVGKEGSTSAGATEAPKKKKKRRWGWFRIGRRRRRNAIEGELTAAAAAAAIASGSGDAEVCENSAGALGDDRQVLASVGWVRIFLLTLVSALAVYNVALFLDGMSQ